MSDLTEENLEKVCEEIQKLCQDRGTVISIKPTWAWIPVVSEGSQEDWTAVQ